MTSENQPVQAVLFDWAGTTVDFGSRAPTQVFIEVLRRRGVDITAEEARGPMGRAKREHIAMVAGLDRVARLWQQIHGHIPSEQDVDAMYFDFLPLQKEILQSGSDVISGVAEAVDNLRSRGIRIGSSTGYTRELMEVVVPIAAAQGYSPDVVICSDDVPAGRPAPWSNLLAAQRLNVYPLNQIVIVDDTAVGIEAGRYAGMKTIAVSLTGNAMGLSSEEVDRLSPTELDSRLQRITRQFLDDGADYVIRSVAELPELLENEFTANPA